MNPITTLQTLIDQTKKLPNGLLRNKFVSRLEDAKIVAQLMAYETQKRFGDPEGQINPEQSACICPEGAIDRKCPVHGGANGD